MPTWVLNAKNPEGEFLRACGCKWVTSSGYVNCLTAGGKQLSAGFPSLKVLEEFRKLPEEERKPAGGPLADLSPGEQSIVAPPKNGLILRVHTRAMARDDKGGYRQVVIDDCPLFKGDVKRFADSSHYFGPNTDYMWITEEEWRSLLPASPAKGDRVEVGKAIAHRLALFHLMPRRLTSEGAGWSKSALKSAKLSLVVADTNEERIRFRAEGFAHLGSDYDAHKATTPNGPLPFGYAAPLHGIVEFDRKKDAFRRFDLVAVGDVWGRWGDANNKSLFVERPGREPLLVGFELARGEAATDRLPPGGNGSYVGAKSGYFTTGK